MCVMMATLDVVVQGRMEGFPVKGKYVVQMLVVIQAIWLNGSRIMYVNKKLMIIVALVKQGK